MFHPDQISFKSQAYDLSHLRQHIGRFSWKEKKSGGNSEFSVRLRFSNHCYSEEIKGDRVILEDDKIVSENPTRVFCPVRHEETPVLVELMKGLIQKPTSSVALTRRTTGGGMNWKVYKLYTRLDGKGDGRYTVFFSVSSGFDGLPDAAKGIDLYVESAYLKDKKVPVITNVPFGRVAEMTWNGERYF